MPAVTTVPPPPMHYRLSIQSGRRRLATITTKVVTVADRAGLDAEIRQLKRGERCVGWEIARPHRCSTCDRLGPWTDEWTWYGSYAEMEAGKDVIKSCSEVCRAEAKRRGMVPRNAPNLDGEADA